MICMDLNVEGSITTEILVNNKQMGLGNKSSDFPSAVRCSLDSKMQTLYNLLEDEKGRTQLNLKGFKLVKHAPHVTSGGEFLPSPEAVFFGLCGTVLITNNSAALENAECLQSARQHMNSNVNKMIVSRYSNLLSCHMQGLLITIIMNGDGSVGHIYEWRGTGGS